MCLEKPNVWGIPIAVGSIYALALMCLYVGFYFIFGPITLGHAVGYFLFMASKLCVLLASLLAIYVVVRDLPDWRAAFIVVMGFMFAIFLGIISLVKLFEPTRQEMDDYLDQYYNNRYLYPFGAPLYLIYAQSTNKCCGINGYEDYNRVLKNPTKVTVPSSCCRSQWKYCGVDVLLGSPKSTKERIYVEGCFPSSVHDIGEDRYAVYKVINSIPICSVLLDLAILLLFAYNFRNIVKRSGNRDPATVVTYPSGSVVSYVEDYEVPEGPVKKPQPFPLVLRNQYR